MEISTVPAYHVRTILSFAERKGLSRQQLLSSCNLSNSILKVETALVPLSSFISLANAVMLEMEDESCGMLPRPVKPGSFALLCQSCIDCKTLEHFLKRRIKFFHLISADVELSLRQGDGLAYYEIDTRDDSASLSQHIIIVILALAYKMGSWSIRERIPLSSVSVCGDRHKLAGSYDHLFDLAINYGQSRNQLCFPEKYLDSPVLQDAKSLEQFLKAPAFHLMSDYGVCNSLAYEIRKFLEDQAWGDFPALDTIAEKYNLSVATLRRRLQGESTSFQEIKDEVRRDIAISVLVRDGNVKSAAYAAGFSEPTSFFRAFKRWTGTTPKAYIS